MGVFLCLKNRHFKKFWYFRSVKTAENIGNTGKYPDRVWTGVGFPSNGFGTPGVGFRIPVLHDKEIGVSKKGGAVGL